MNLPKKFKDEEIYVLYEEAQVKERVRQLAKEICAAYSDSEPILCICVLKGAVMFFADLVKELEGRDVLYDFITLSSYSNEINSSGNVKIISNVNGPVKGRHVLIIEDIVDSGYTLQFLNSYFASMDAADVKTVCLLDKPVARKVDIKPDFAAFTLKDAPFIIGYGLDYAQFYRNLKNICGVDVTKYK